MEIIGTQIPQKKRFKYFGKGTEFAIIYFKNIILTLLTLGLYYPWAKVEFLKYHYQSTELDNVRFSFHATGNEVFRGFIKVYAIIFVLYAFLIYAMQTQNETLLISSTLFFYLFFILILPFAIHGAIRYRSSRSSWKGIHFKYLGDRKELFMLYIKGLFLTIITFGIYSPWLQVDIRKYIFSNLQFGNLKFKFKGEGLDLFWIMLKLVLLFYITLGIYGFFFYRNILQFYIDNIEITQENKKIPFKLNMTTGDVFELLIVNFLLILFTFGLATPWVIVRTSKFILRFIVIEEGLDTDIILQSKQDDYDDATGDDFLDFLDFDLL
jgi:uncharacterized membrane protein YjgN (DUF898 family)